MNLIENAPFVNVVAGQKATLQLPIGVTYNGVLLGLTNVTKAQLTRIVVRTNKKIHIDASGSHLDAMNTYKGGAVDAGFLLIDFTEHQAKDILSEFAGSIGTGEGVSSLTVEVTIDGAAVNPALKSWGMVSSPAALSGNIHTMIPQTVSYSGAGTWDLELPHGEGSAHVIKRVWLFKDSGAGVVSEVEAKKNGLEIHKLPAAANEFIQKHYEGTPPASCYCVDFVAGNHVAGEALTTKDAQDLRLKITTSGAITLTYYIESFANLGEL